jgi:predicted acyltransferase
MVVGLEVSVTIAPASLLLQTTPMVPTQSRLQSIDVLRGICVGGMIMVMNAGNWSYVYAPLKHAEWNGVTPTDMIFPAFLFLTGLSMTFSFAKRSERGESAAALRWHVLARSVTLVALGLVLNAFQLIETPGLRIPGVLQRIGICYMGGGLYFLAVRERPYAVRLISGVGGIFALLAAYWALMTLVPVPGYGAGRLDATGNLGAFIDRSVFGPVHLWFWGGRTWDPEGLLSSLPATANVLAGVVAGEWLRGFGRRRTLGLVVAGVALVLTAVALNTLIPINKKIWTPSFMLFSSGVSLVSFCIVHWLVDERLWRWGLTPALVFGTNAILGYSIANALNPLLSLVHLPLAGGGSVKPPEFVFRHLSDWMNPCNASLGYALMFVAVNLCILLPLYHRRIFLRL